MRPICDGSHELPHLPWGFADPAAGGKWNFSTEDEAEYPTMLCQRAAQLLHSACVEQGAVPVPTAISDPGLTSRQSKLLTRAATGKLPRDRQYHSRCRNSFALRSPWLTNLPRIRGSFVNFLNRARTGQKERRLFRSWPLQKTGAFLGAGYQMSSPDGPIS